MNLNMSVNENKIISLTNDQDDISNKWFIGKPINVIYDLKKQVSGKPIRQKKQLNMVVSRET